MILITGATSGIGEATAKICAENGHDLLLVARRRDRLETISAELTKAYKNRVITFALDIQKLDEVRDFARQATTTLEQVTVLVNNAGVAKGLSTIQETDPSAWNTMIDTNVKGLLAMTHEVLPHMIKKKSGHIVNLGSVAGHINYLKGNIYCATKAAVHSLNECMRLDLLGSGVRVTEVSPGMVETEFSQVRLGDAEKAKAVYAGMTPLSARDIAETIYWCINRPAHVNIQEVVIYPTDQASPWAVHRR
jgi:3-hydroxy acid dehydrogenase / malonic semialdehyde reductase